MAVVAPLLDPSADPSLLCRHCGDPCESDAILSVDGRFCCRGCESVYSILKAHQLEGFYTCDIKPGAFAKRCRSTGHVAFAALDDPQLAAAFVQFDDGRVARGVLPALNRTSRARHLVYAAVAAAAAFGDIKDAALLMAGFAVGTLPALTAVSISASAIPPTLRLRLRPLMPVVLALAGVMLLARGIAPASVGHAPGLGHSQHASQ